MFAALNTIEPPIVDLQIAKLVEGNGAWYQQRLPLVRERLRKRLGELSGRLGQFAAQLAVFTAASAS